MTIRVILKRTIFDANVNSLSEDFITKDVELPEIEALLLSGGRGETGFDKTDFVGIEIIANPEGI